MNAQTAKTIKEIVELFGPMLDDSRGLDARARFEKMLHDLADGIKQDAIEP